MATRTTTTKPRQPAGIPVGGQFAASAHTEADLSLDEVSGLTVTDEMIAQFAAEAARNEAGRYPGQIDRDDLAQEAALEYVKRRKKNLDAIASGDVSAEQSAVLLSHPGPYIQTIAHGLAQRVVTGFEQSYERSAIKGYLDAKRSLEQHLGRALTGAEEDDLATQIRDDQPPGRRAKEGFHRTAPGTVSLDDEDGPDRLSKMAAAGATGTDLGTSGGGGDVPEGTMAAALLDAIDAGEANARADARRNAWAAVAEMRGVPNVIAESLSESEAAAARRALNDHGGAVAVARMWSAETAETPAQIAACEALFVPFGGTTDFDDQEAIVATLISLRDSGADQMFDFAIGSATRKRKKT